MELRKAIFIKFYMDICCYAKCVSPKHVELKVHNKYSIALSW